MTKKAVALLLVFSIILCLFSCDNTKPASTPSPTQQETPTPTATPDPWAPYKTMNAGSAQKLLGNCVFINVFLSDGESSFTLEEKQQHMALLETVENKLKEEISLYNKEFSFIYNLEDLSIDYTVDYTIDRTTRLPTDLFPGHENWDVDIITNICSAYDINAIAQKYKADNIAFLLNIRKVARSYAHISHYYSPASFSAEFVVLFTDLSTERHYTHEILHLFGAIDFYTLVDERLSLIEEYFPNEVMLTNYYDKRDSIISPPTAYLLGWTNSLEQKYEIFLEKYKFD